MGVCGSSQICRSKENDAKSQSNMQQKQKSLSEARQDVFDHDKRKYRLGEDNKIASSPSSQSLSSSDLISPPNPSAQTKSNISIKLRNTSTNSEFIESDSNEDGEDVPKCKTSIKLPPNAPSMSNKARISRNFSSSAESIITAKPDIAGIKARKSAKHCYVALEEEEHDEIDPDDEEEQEQDNNNDENIDNNNQLKDSKRKKTDTNTIDENSNPPTPLPYTVNTSNKSNPRSPFAHDSINDTPSNKFVRSNNKERRRASSQDIITAAEYALMEDSNTKGVEDYTGLVTPLTTPCNTNNNTNVTSPFNKIAMMKSRSKSDNTDDGLDHDHRSDITSPNGAYPIDFQDNLHSHPGARSNKGSITSSITKHHNKAGSLDSLNINHAHSDPSHKMHRELGARRNAGGNSMMSGPLSNFSINSTHSQSSVTNTVNTTELNQLNQLNQQNINRIHHSTHFNGNDNININNFYTTTREPNLSMSTMQPSLLGANVTGGQFPRVSSTSSDFAHLLEHGYRKDSKTEDNSDFIKWRFSVDGGIAGSQTNLPTYNSLSSIPIDRVSSRDHDQSLTDL